MLNVQPVGKQHVEVDVEAIPGILPSTPSGPAFGSAPLISATAPVHELSRPYHADRT